MISGSLALMYAANPNLTVADAEHALFGSSTDSARKVSIRSSAGEDSMLGKP